MSEPLNSPRVLSAVTCTNAAAVKILDGADALTPRQAVLLTCEGAACRIGDKLTGTKLSATVGTPMGVGEKLVIPWTLGSNWYVIGQSASTTTLQVTVIR